MSYDFDYYSGADLRYPTKPTEPSLGLNPKSFEARAYADALEDYERQLEGYQEDKSYYDGQLNLRLVELKNYLIDDYGITEAQMNVLWSRAWDDGHSAGLSEVFSYFDRFYSMASEFAALQKG